MQIKFLEIYEFIFYASLTCAVDGLKLEIGIIQLMQISRFLLRAVAEYPSTLIN